MKVTNLAAWAGADFSYAPGDIIDLPDAVAQDRIAAGVCVAVTVETEPKKAKTKDKAD